MWGSYVHVPSACCLSWQKFENLFMSFKVWFLRRFQVSIKNCLKRYCLKWYPTKNSIYSMILLIIVSKLHLTIPNQKDVLKSFQYHFNVLLFYSLLGPFFEAFKGTNQPGQGQGWWSSWWSRNGGPIWGLLGEGRGSNRKLVKPGPNWQTNIAAWKINMVHLQITHETKGKWSSQPLWLCSMLIFQGVAGWKNPAIFDAMVIFVGDFVRFFREGFLEDFCWKTHTGREL